MVFAVARAAISSSLRLSSSPIRLQWTPSDRSARCGLLLARGGDQALPLRLLARELSCPADCLAFFPRRFLRRLFVEPPALHLAEDALPLHLLFQRPERLVDIVVADEYLQKTIPFCLLGSAAGKKIA